MFSSFKSLMLVAAALFSSLVSAADYQAGKEYLVLDNPVAVMQDGKIHVEEAFWYGCPHCFHLEPQLEAWRKTLPADVDFEGVPAMFGKAWITHAQLYYTADALGVLDKVHKEIFESIHLKKVMLLRPDDQKAFLVEKAGVTPDEFDKAYNSFTVKSRMKRGDQRIRAFQINGVPALIVNGKYVVNASTAGSQEAMIDVVDFLIEKERAGN
tara:strand:- start:878 stop:1510 length:633 start_codon:yes stop_codon:yes gene_type:complete